MAQYSTKDGDTLDEIAYRYYGSTDNQVVENIIDANFGITDYPPILPAGVLIELPEAKQSIEKQKVKLWD
ncbi:MULTISPECIES: tail protein X [Acinetobacter]|uniref:tail protein X n=1 Tax=Acinetobacter TaxID=469 RepID=UPI0015B44620|nr:MULTISPECIES: tail protein X [Acinetobacter]MBT0886299.1 tail protein X [Acinetobacter towneri]NWJ91706.1 tail protein X [Acinetobacter sp. Swhac1]